jgi:hypothetical protein
VVFIKIEIIVVMTLNLKRNNMEESKLPDAVSDYIIKMAPLVSIDLIIRNKQVITF